jgi:hypothetical protein
VENFINFIFKIFVTLNLRLFNDDLIRIVHITSNSVRRLFWVGKDLKRKLS